MNISNDYDFQDGSQTEDLDEVRMNGEGIEIVSLDELEHMQQEDMDGHSKHTYRENDPDSADDEDNYWNEAYYEKGEQ